ncbi:MAG: hypothetical protein KC800_34335 [Candidatus Eremiobacteraeota bacterium]|nr:hypothetical protein [Candidatus Eremiobacteraeota bacterium]
MKRSGMTMTEVVVAMGVLATVIIAYLSVSRTASSSASQSRNYALATIVAQNVIAEISAHQYGEPRPDAWLDISPFLVVEGRESQVKFKLAIEPDTESGGNGSFFGASAANVDVLNVRVSWREPLPSGGGSREQDISFRLTVRRENGVY